jgi:type IV pilus assembly protein PilY1
LGRGGKGLFGLDVTDPASFDGDDVLWEYFPPGDVDLGFMLGRPIIAQLQNGTWAVIVGNGYNSTSQRAVLYVFNLSTGALIRKMDTGVAGDNGMATPGLILDNAGRVTTAYAGDLLGNVWKFNLSIVTPADWSIAHSGQPLFTATDSGGVRQPITAPITLTMKTQPEYSGDPHVGRWFVHFGTGSDFQTSDPSNTALQTWYGLVDTGTPISRSELLLTPGLLNVGEVAGRPVRTMQIVGPETMQTRRGWALNLTVNGVLEGERMVTASRFYSLANPTLIASSVIPVEDVCRPGGRGYLNAVNPFTGGRLTSPLFDVNDDNNFNADDTLGGVYPGSIDIGVGKPGEPVLVGNRLVGGGSLGDVGDVGINRGTVTGFRGRISWREVIR